MVQTVWVIVEAAERERLAAIVADRNRPRKHVERARIVLASTDRDRLLRDRRDEKRASIRMRNCRRMPTKGGGSPTEVANLATGAAPQEAVFSGGRAARANFDQIGTASLRGAGGRRSNLECCSGGEADQVRTRLAAGGNGIRTSGPPVRV